MSEKYFKKISAYLVSVVVIFVLGQLMWEHFTTGVVSHHLLHSSDLPAISNWWGLIVLPSLAWFTTIRVKKRITFSSDEASADEKIPNSILVGFFAMLLVSLMQAVAFEFGYESVTMNLALGVLVMGLFLPIYRAECILGHVLGASVTFGAIIPVLGMLVFAMISAFSNVLVKPLLINIWGRIKHTKTPAKP